MTFKLDILNVLINIFFNWKIIYFRLNRNIESLKKIICNFEWKHLNLKEILIKKKIRSEARI